jgi:hypothetical protein
MFYSPKAYVWVIPYVLKVIQTAVGNEFVKHGAVEDWRVEFSLLVSKGFYVSLREG